MGEDKIILPTLQYFERNLLRRPRFIGYVDVAELPREFLGMKLPRTKCISRRMIPRVRTRVRRL